jgi:hypothetical protein
MQVLISGQLFIEYAKQVAEQLDQELQRIEALGVVENGGVEKVAEPVIQDLRTRRTGS